MNLANKITIARIILIPFFIAAIIYSRKDIALAIFILAITTDGIDGFIARSMKQKTRFGTIIDPVADKLLLVSAYICLSISASIPQEFRMPPYVLIAVISRDAIIVLGSIMVHMITGDLKVSPSIIGKLTTFFQMITIVSVLAQFKYSYIVWNAAIALTMASGIDYVVKGSKLLTENHSVLKRSGG